MQQQNPAEEKFVFYQYRDILLRNKWFVISFVLTCTTLTTLIVFLMTPVYISTAKLLVDKPKANILSMQEIFGLDSKRRNYLMTQVEILKSERIARRVISKLRLTSNRTFLPKKKNAIGKMISSILDSITPPSTEKPGASGIAADNRGYGYKELALKRSVRILSKKLKIKQIKKTQLISISYASRSPELSAIIANAVAEAYMDDFLASRAKFSKKAGLELNDRIEGLKENLNKTEKKLQDYLEQQKLVDVKGVGTLTEKQLTERAKQVDTAETKVFALSKRYGPKHPTLLAAKSELHFAKQLLAAGKTKMLHIGRKQVKIRELKREIQVDRKLYQTFLNRMKEVNESAKLGNINARLVDVAIPPKKPSKPKKIIIIPISFFGSLVLGMLFIYIIEVLNSNIRSIMDIETKLQQPALGLLPILTARPGKSPNVASAMVEAVNADFAEAMSTIRTGVILSSLDNPSKMLLITSSAPEEGKTTTAISLAISMGKMEKVVLIDANMRRPAIHQWCSIKEKQPGLSDVVAGVAGLDKCIVQHEDLGVDLIAAGQHSPNPLELLSSKSFGQLLEDLEQDYDRIIVDSPPVQAVSDALVLSQYAKSVVYVVKANSTHANSVKTGIERLLKYGAPLTGVVLNMVDAQKVIKDGGDHEGYYDQYGYSKVES